MRIQLKENTMTLCTKI